MFKKVLIANRGEIALRVVRACKELGIRTLAVYSEADIDSLHVQLADEAICIGPAPSAQSYLKIDRIISAAEIGDVDAIHPGYGFLAENAHFADVCASCNIKFIGPPPSSIRAMGDKNIARATARKAGVPVTPGSDGIVETEQEALKIAKKIGYPVMIKAVAGGGGKGMRPAHNDVSLVQGFHGARLEAEKAFGNPGVYVEKLIERPHHIEFQIMADSVGNVVHIGERDCSMQRRNQKIIEECPSPLMTDKLRSKMGACSVKLAQSVGYIGAGTMEYLVNDKGEFYFMEMNTRIQVEHPVTEMVTVSDLVSAQIRVSAGEPLNLTQDELMFVGHSIECRINAEDPETFTPSPGRITTFNLPSGPGVRVDTAIYSGYVVPPHYDSLIAKLVVHARTRERAIARMRRALGAMVVEGIKTTIPLHLRILEERDFIEGNLSTDFMDRFLE
ncbi:MAG TPA: acetyl-CoA carboxylase biotin carboxylase subunit [Chthoniobacteraceae bacterium]|nr:acetyl-CoA carboxylase biotin carboxylase subunit [Chthoniobacteraceae bacterium]